MGLISTRRRKFAALAASAVLSASTVTGLVALGGGAAAVAPDQLAAEARETADVLVGLRFLEQATATLPVTDTSVSADGVVDLSIVEPTTEDPRIGWFKATYADKQRRLADLLSSQLDIPADEFVAAWSATDDVRMRVMYAALTELGDPYVWASTGPDGFDCSGLMVFAWGTVGIELPHMSVAQANLGEAVLAQEVKVGDLVHSPGHIMMSLGVRDAVVQSTHGGVQVGHWGSNSDAFTDPLRPRTVNWTVADGVRRGPDGRIARGGAGNDEPPALAPEPVTPSVPAADAPVEPSATPAPEPITAAAPAAESAPPDTAG